MIASLPTKRISATSQWQAFLRVLPTRWRWKPAGIEIMSQSPYVLQLNRSIKCHWKNTTTQTVSRTKTWKKHKNMKDNCRMTKQAYIQIQLKTFFRMVKRLYKHYTNHNQTLFTLTFRPLSETFVRRSCSILLPVLATEVRKWRDVARTRRFFWQRSLTEIETSR